MLLWVPLAVILSAAAWLGSIPTVCVPIQHNPEVIACFEKVVP